MADLDVTEQKMNLIANGPIPGDASYSVRFWPLICNVRVSTDPCHVGWIVCPDCRPAGINDRGRFRARYPADVVPKYL